MAFRLKDGFADKPMQVPCGACIGCRQARARMWSVRCVHESKMHKVSWFVTLTYDDKHLPANGSLSKRDWQLFMKRFREKRGRVGSRGGMHPAEIRFFMCGQYGERTLRPHYHALLFGVDFPDKRLHVSSNRGSGKELFVSAELEDLWRLGECKFSPLNMATVHYVTAYMNRSSLDKEMCSRYGLEPEFQLMSRRPGIGARFIRKYRSDVYPDGFVTLPGGVKTAAPRFYDDYMEEVDPALMERVRMRRLIALRRSKDNSGKRLIVREAVANSKAKFFSGNDPEA